MLSKVFLVAVCLLQQTYIIPTDGDVFKIQSTIEMMKSMTRSPIINNKRFIFVTTPNNWHMAATICRFNGMQLAVINSVKEQNIIGKLYGDSGYVGSNQIWTSGNDLGRKYEWYWASNGKPVNYTNWADGAPDDSIYFRSGEHCISLGADNQYLWNDAPCHLLFTYICEEGVTANATVKKTKPI